MGASRSQSRNDSSSRCEFDSCLFADHFAARLSDARASKKLQLASNFAPRGGRCVARGHRSFAVARPSAQPLAEWSGSNGRAIEAVRRDAKSAGAKRTCASALLDTQRPCDMLARGKRTGIPVTCRPRRTSTHSRRSGSNPTDPVETQEPWRWATEERHFESLLHEARRRAGGTPHQLETICAVRPCRASYGCDLSLCFDVRGMRIAAHFRQAHDRQRSGASS